MKSQSIQAAPSRYLPASLLAGAYTVFGYLLGLAVAGICVGSLRLDQVWLMIAFTWAGPFLTGLFVFRPLAIFRRLPIGYLHSLRQLVLVELISVNLVLGITAPLFDLLRHYWIGTIIEPGDATVWLCVAISTLAGVAALVPFYYWLYRNGLMSLVPCLYCPRGAEDDSDLALPQNIWIPLTISILLFIAGTYVTIRIQ